MNRKIMLIPVVVIIVFIFSILSYLKINEQRTINIVVTTENYNSISKLLKKFGKKNNIKINILKDEYFGNMDKLSLVINGYDKSVSHVPDMYYIINDWIEKAVSSGVISEVNLSDLRGVADMPREGAKYNDKYYGYPFTWETQALFYNPKLINKEAKTIDELLENADAAEKKHQNIKGFSFPATGYFTFPFHTLFGGNIITAKNCTSPESKEIFKKELKFLKGIIKYKSKDDSDVFAFGAGNIAMMIQGTWIINSLKENGCEYEVAALPDDRMKPLIGVKSIAISTKTKNRDAALKVAKYMISYEFQKELGECDYFITTNKKLLEEKSDKHSKIILESAKKGILLPISSNMEEYWYKSDLLLRDALKKDKDIDKSVDIILRGE